MRTLAPLLVATCIFAQVAHSQSNDSWAAWLAAVQPLVAVKEDGIKQMTAYRDEVCPRQSSDEKRTSCKARFDEIVKRRTKEKEILTAMLDAFKLPNGEGIVLIEIVNPVSNKMNAETTTMANEALAAYPR